MGREPTRLVREGRRIASFAEDEAADRAFYDSLTGEERLRLAIRMFMNHSGTTARLDRTPESCSRIVREK